MNHGADGNGPIKSSGRREGHNESLRWSTEHVETPGTTQGPGAVIVGHVEPTDRGWSPDGRCSSVKTDLAMVVAASLYLHRREGKVHSEFAPCWSQPCFPSACANHALEGVT